MHGCLWYEVKYYFTPVSLTMFTFPIALSEGNKRHNCNPSFHLKQCLVHILAEYSKVINFRSESFNGLLQLWNYTIMKIWRVKACEVLLVNIIGQYNLLYSVHKSHVIEESFGLTPVSMSKASVDGPKLARGLLLSVKSILICMWYTPMTHTLHYTTHIPQIFLFLLLYQV